MARLNVCADQAEDAFRCKMLSEEIIEILDQRLKDDDGALVSTMHLLVELIKHGESRDIYVHRHSSTRRGFAPQVV